ncbi:hypothetical protein HELRODRAFT_162809 [Helobdella robusta]|uniref:Apple domain-containing protein n=1 Tax=Helobdella robusta TaxID=6412 RepID=T1ET71_HELRO|nr:hypothetical protein HELRODRAFT_162809 [Helobdella robusta]ESN99291.1 hypothetical protein HELRODRAFT_162809 [Helobdella robusta]
MSVSLCYLVILIFISGSESQLSYEIKPITFCPVVTLDGHLSNYNDRWSLATNSTTIAECSLECSTREHNLRCQAFTFDQESSTCQLHSSSPDRGSSLTEVAWYNRSTANTDPLGGRIVKLPGANKSITHLVSFIFFYVPSVVDNI